MASLWYCIVGHGRNEIAEGGLGVLTDDEPARYRFAMQLFGRPGQGDTNCLTCGDGG